MKQQQEFPIQRQQLLENLTIPPTTNDGFKDYMKINFFFQGINQVQFVKDALRDLMVAGGYLFSQEERGNQSTGDITQADLQKRFKINCNIDSYLADAICAAHSQDTGNFVSSFLSGGIPFGFIPSLQFDMRSICTNNYFIKQNKAYLEKHYSPIPIKDSEKEVIIGYTGSLTVNYIVKEPDIYICSNKKAAKKLVKGNAIGLIINQQSGNTTALFFKDSELQDQVEVELNSEEQQLLLSATQFSIEKLEYQDTRIPLLRKVIKKIIDNKPEINLFGCVLESISTPCNFLNYLLLGKCFDNQNDFEIFADMELNKTFVDYFLNDEEKVKNIFSPIFLSELPYQKNLDTAFSFAVKKLNDIFTPAFKMLTDEKREDKKEALRKQILKVTQAIKKEEEHKLLTSSMETYFREKFNDILNDKLLLDDAIDARMVIFENEVAVKLSSCADCFTEEGEKNESRCKEKNITIDESRIKFQEYPDIAKFSLRKRLMIDAAQFVAGSNLQIEFKYILNEINTDMMIFFEQKHHIKYLEKAEEFQKFNKLLMDIPEKVLTDFFQISKNQQLLLSMEELYIAASLDIKESTTPNESDMSEEKSDIPPESSEYPQVNREDPLVENTNHSIFTKKLSGGTEPKSTHQTLEPQQIPLARVVFAETAPTNSTQVIAPLVITHIEHPISRKKLPSGTEVQDSALKKLVNLSPKVPHKQYFFSKNSKYPDRIIDEELAGAFLCSLISIPLFFIEPITASVLLAYAILLIAAAIYQHNSNEEPNLAM